jgi:Ser/Thr protein kinase RdoA (MazF antagonist)
VNKTEFDVALAGEGRDFDRAMGWLARRTFANPGERAAVVASAIRAIASSALAIREIDRRCRMVINSVHQDEALLKLVVAGIQGVHASALNAVRSALPSHLRPLAMARPAQGDLSPTTEAIATLTASSSPIVALPSPEAELPLVPTVVLVGTEFEQAANRAMLNRSGFHPLGVSSLDLLWTMDRQGLCGIVVASSAWSGLDVQGQDDAITRLCSWSTFTFTRISLEGLVEDIARRVPALLEVGLGRSTSERFFHGANANLTPADIELIRASAALLSVAEETRFVPLDAREDALLLRLIAGQRRSLDRAVEVRLLGAAQMHGGKSKARIFMLQFEHERPFVVKLDEPSELRKELQRHQGWIAAWEPNVTDPVIHHHEGRSAISYRLQAHPDGIDRPAPTLEAELERLRGMEWWNREAGQDPALQLGEALEAAITRAADRLSELNKRPASGFGEQFWLDWPAAGLAKRSVAHEVIGHDERTFDLASIVSKATELLAPMHDKGVVHGDIHGRNILLADRLPAFIDYATSGPGHPLVDLVRLDAAVRHLVMRATVGEKALAALFVALYVNGTSATDLLASNPTLANSPSCRLVLTTAAKTRACALEVAARFQGGLREYLAMLTVISAHMLVVRTPGSAIERAVLAAVAPSLMEAAPRATSAARASSSATRASFESVDET